MSKHLTYDDRLNIQDLLKSGSSISCIARKLNRHKSTISREITLRAMFRKVGGYGHTYNACLYRFDCDMKNLCKKDMCINIKFKKFKLLLELT